MQWTPGQFTGLYFGTQLPAPVAVAPFGEVWLDPLQLIPYGIALVGGNSLADFPYAIPNNPALSGLSTGLQGIGTTALPAGLLASTFQAFYIR